MVHYTKLLTHQVSGSAGNVRETPDSAYFSQSKQLKIYFVII